MAACRQALVAQHAQGFYFRALAATLAVLHYLDVFGPGHAVFIDSTFPLLVRLRAPQHQQFANVLHSGGIQIGRQFLVHEFARSAVVAENANFDQAVCIQCSVDFLAHVGGEAIAAHHDYRGEMVRIGTVCPALGRWEFNMGHGPYYRGRMKEI